MVKIPSGREAKVLELFRHHNKLLTAIREHTLCDPEEQNYHFIFQHCCDILADAFQCDSVWAGDIDREECCLVPFASSPASALNSSLQRYIADYLIEHYCCSLSSFTKPLHLKPYNKQTTQPLSADSCCLVWPVRYQHCTYGFVALHCRKQVQIGALQKEFITNVIDDIALALFSQDTALKLKIERDFNKEIVDTIEALMVGIRPCGTIVSFNKRAELVTGYKEEEILEKYWVDILINPHNRLQFQQLFSEILRGAPANINFKAPLLTKNGMERYISWHGSIRHDIEKGKVGLVMLEIDETDNLVADRQLNMFTAHLLPFKIPLWWYLTTTGSLKQTRRPAPRPKDVVMK